MSQVAKRHTIEQIETGLQLLALNAGAYEKTVTQLREHGIHLTRQSLHNWANKSHADRYFEIRTQIHSQVAERAASQAEEIAFKAGELELRIIEKLDDQLDDLDPKDAATALRNLSTTKALNHDKVIGPIRGRPTVIVENRDAAQILQELQRLGVVEGTAEEILP